MDRNTESEMKALKGGGVSGGWVVRGRGCPKSVIWTSGVHGLLI